MPRRHGSTFLLRGRSPVPRTAGPSTWALASSLSGDPLANKCRAAFQRGASGFAPCQEPHGVLIDEIDFLEVQNESTSRRFAFNQPAEVWEMLAVDATAQR